MPPMPNKLRVSAVPSSNGRLEARWPAGDKPNTGAVLAGDAGGLISTSANISSAIQMAAAASAQASAAADLSAGASFDAQLLYAGLSGIAWEDDSGSNAVEWRTDDTEGYARIYYNIPYTSGLRYTHTNRSAKQIYVSYWIRRHFNECSKQLKTLGQVQGNGDSANSTFGPTAGGYAGNEYSLYFGDATSGGNDNNAQLLLNGAFTGGGYFNAGDNPTIIYAPAHVYQDITGTVWEHWESYTKFTDNDANNGEYGLAKNGVRVFQMANVRNSPNNAQFRDLLDFGGYAGFNAPASGFNPFYEDYKKGDISTTYRPSWMT